MWLLITNIDYQRIPFELPTFHHAIFQHHPSRHPNHQCKCRLFNPKRSLLPGYHIEWKKGVTSPLSLDQTHVQHASIPNDIDDVYAAEVSLSDEHLLASEMQPTFPSVIASLQHIPPSAIERVWKSSQLVEPTPWAEAEKKQQRFGKIALGAFLAFAFLVAIYSPIA